VLVVDANVIVEVTLERLGAEALGTLGDEQLVAPWLLWSWPDPLRSVRLV
jgi:hypothetical protein